MPTFGSLFAGIGGIDLGLERASWECRWQVEIDPFCQKVLAKHWPDVRRYGDVRDCGKHNLETVDLIAGGFPCQPYSLAGKRGGESDDRNLWPEYRRIVAELRPAWVLAENVPGIINRNMLLAYILSLPTIGPVFIQALVVQDSYMAGTCLVFLVMLTLIGNLLSDIGLAWLDPRIRLE